jgi:hypothetical protein
MSQNFTACVVIRSSLGTIGWGILHVTELREEVAAITGSRVPFVNAKILHSKTHCDDYIEVSPLDTLARELEVPSAGMKPGTHLVPAFVRQLRELIAVARQEGHPIYFG